MLSEAPVLRGERVELGPLMPEDTQAMVDAQDDAWLAAFDARHAWTLEGALGVIREANRQWSEQVGPDRRFAVRMSATGEYLGEILARALNAWNSIAMIEIRLTPDARGQGYGGEAVELAAHFAIEEMKATGGVEAHITSENLESIRLFERLGFRRDGTARSGGRDTLRYRRG